MPAFKSRFNAGGVTACKFCFSSGVALLSSFKSRFNDGGAPA
jgi:hypothetical protein